MTPIEEWKKRLSGLLVPPEEDTTPKEGEEPVIRILTPDTNPLRYAQDWDCLLYTSPSPRD